MSRLSIEYVLMGNPPSFFGGSHLMVVKSAPMSVTWRRVGADGLSANKHVMVQMHW